MLPGQNEAIEKWRLDAIADGWEHKPSDVAMDGTVLMPEEIESELDKDGWHALVYNRPDGYQEISVWGKDQLAVDTPDAYSMVTLEWNSHRCMYCKDYFPETVRIGFAGRCCQPCRVKHVAEVEYSGWCN